MKDRTLYGVLTF